MEEERKDLEVWKDFLWNVKPEGGKVDEQSHND